MSTDAITKAITSTGLLPVTMIPLVEATELEFITHALQIFDKLEKKLLLSAKRLCMDE